MKIEELINDIKYTTFDGHSNTWEVCDPDKVREIMILYAEYYAKKCLGIAAENATTECVVPEDEFCPDFTNAYEIVDKDSILNIKLPEHE